MVESVHLEAGEEPIVVVLRVGHRPGRDKRISTHVGLVARAFGAQGVIFAGEIEETVIKSIQRVVETWGGPFFVKIVRSYREAINQWKEEGGIVVHLTMYGENIVGSNVLERIKRRGRKVMVVVGAEKVPAELYELADFNVAIGNQPHSEVGALAVFLDRFFGGAELLKEYLDAKIRIIPSPRSKIVERIHR